MKINTGLRRRNKPTDLEEQRAKENFRRVVFHRAGGRSQLTGAQDHIMDCHHTIPKQTLKRIRPDLVWEPDIAILITRAANTKITKVERV